MIVNRIETMRIAAENVERAQIAPFARYLICYSTLSLSS